MPHCVPCVSQNLQLILACGYPGYAGRLTDYFRRLKAARLAVDNGQTLPPGYPPLKVRRRTNSAFHLC